MRKTLVVLVLLLCAVCLLAQDNMGKSSDDSHFRDPRVPFQEW